jgi:hypothetical protein
VGVSGAAEVPNDVQKGRPMNGKTLLGASALVVALVAGTAKTLANADDGKDVVKNDTTKQTVCHPNEDDDFEHDGPMVTCFW